MTSIHLKSLIQRPQREKVLTVNPRDLEAALALDSDPLREDERNKMIKSFGGLPENDAA